MQSLFKALKVELPTLTEANVKDSFESFGVDSFDLVTLRVAVETACEMPIADDVWTQITSPADILALSEAPIKQRTVPVVTLNATRKHVIGMPQMAVSGLSESWLFKEIGDLHWQLITDGLGVPSSQIADGNGERLYATFTRLRMEHSKPLNAVLENSDFEMTGSMSRYGAGIFTSEIHCRSGENSTSANVVSSFAKRGTNDSNKSLMKGQPTIPEDSPINVLLEKPALVEEYRLRRSQTYPDALFSCDYQINPYHDINGVGLLYFAAYPSIADTCELKFLAQGNSWAFKSSTVFRDIYYFANSDADELLTYSVLAKRETDGGIEIDALISRKESGLPMAFITTRKKLNG